MERPLILISNDDGYRAKGIRELAKIAMQFEKFSSVPLRVRSQESQGRSQ